jgi:hypothetical protein
VSQSASHIHGRWLLQPSLGRVAIRHARIITSHTPLTESCWQPAGKYVS